jgi:hypothetical protein
MLHAFSQNSWYATDLYYPKKQEQRQASEMFHMQGRRDTLLHCYKTSAVTTVQTVQNQLQY